MPEEPNKRAQLERYAHAFNTSELLKYLSGHLTFSEAGDRVLVRVDPVLPTHRGGMGTAAVNGGVLAATFDFVIGITAALVDPTRRSATMQLNMTFERPVVGDWYTAEAWIDRAGGSTLFSSAAIKDPQGEICSRATGLVRLSKAPWSLDWQQSQTAKP
ncbi:MAG TPA: PaaI family thioesterase [Myxococcaceae bacterium]|nr:PaaI family thioesterase [Myxococcaceae bacterium]